MFTLLAIEQMIQNLRTMILFFRFWSDFTNVWMKLLLSAALRSNAADYVLPLFIYLFFYFFYSTLVLRNYRTDSHQIFRNCVFWCSLNNPVVLKFFGRHLAEKNAKNSENLVKILGVDNNFETVKDNSNLKQTWTRGIVSLHLWKISFWTVQGQLRSICPIGWQNLYFGHFWV